MLTLIKIMSVGVYCPTTSSDGCVFAEGGATNGDIGKLTNTMTTSYNNIIATEVAIGHSTMSDYYDVYRQGSIHRGGGGRGEASPPKHPASPPKKSSKTKKREGPEGEGGGGERILFEIHVNSILLNYVRVYMLYLKPTNIY